ncbi:hypothetical protein [Solirubrum puertoriconensis]|uniref:Uncharacterized protein n=1 Tax=Solirubrum puertoriconensis TaxID=1751427 RepID=A0A9X0HPJ6_SOLP1|nr:hypothetical protein [Solirubrum puertoriconensis]KUG09769.1 hypothetical protein ASU33_19015 [Solirubrum puertoriconensis]
MKKRSLLLRLTSLWLALLVLTSSVGLTVQQHTCFASGQTQRAVVLTPHHVCAPKEAVAKAPGCDKPAAVAKAAVEDGCCDFSAHHHKVDTSASSGPLLKVVAPALLAVLPQPVWAPQAPAAVVAPQLTWHAADSSPPLRTGRALLAFKCTLNV